MPWEFAALGAKQKAALIAMIQETIKSEKKAAKKKVNILPGKKVKPWQVQHKC
ncbi:hypothetical protein HMSSN036_24790 [Paenibacillus macerans]|nr:hypothetical protein HMSSN036_24790 [Paenibacillus macerans]